MLEVYYYRVNVGVTLPDCHSISCKELGKSSGERDRLQLELVRRTGFRGGVGLL